jgi:S1-C subfamily serine protease
MNQVVIADDTSDKNGDAGHGRSSRRPFPMLTPTDPMFVVDDEEIPAGMVGIGTSFAVGNGLWLTARHVANTTDCDRIVIVVGKSRVAATIKSLHEEADLTLLQTKATAPALPISMAALVTGETGVTFGFPSGALGASQEQLLGRARMQLGGRLSGTGPVLAWAEIARYPDSLDTLQGISGGPMFDASGAVIGITVAASKRRGRQYTVAPEILRGWMPMFAPTPAPPPAREIAGQTVALDDVAKALSGNARIAETYCIPKQ